MKAIWKVLLGAAALAAVTPYSVKKDEETGKVVVTSATWKVTCTKNGDDRLVEVKLLPALQKDEGCTSVDECCCCGEEAETGEGITVEDASAEPEA